MINFVIPKDIQVTSRSISLHPMLEHSGCSVLIIELLVTCSETDHNLWGKPTVYQHHVTISWTNICRFLLIATRCLRVVHVAYSRNELMQLQSRYVTMREGKEWSIPGWLRVTHMTSLTVFCNDASTSLNQTNSYSLWIECIYLNSEEISIRYHQKQTNTMLE